MPVMSGVYLSWLAELTSSPSPGAGTMLPAVVASSAPP